MGAPPVAPAGGPLVATMLLLALRLAFWAIALPVAAGVALAVFTYHIATGGRRLAKPKRRRRP
jgi:hypothetical protein